jgi:hypothetical protein
MPVLRRILREPLLHFLIAGGAIYLLYAWWGRDGAVDQHRIVVDRGALLQYMQFQAQAFEPKTFAARFDTMIPAERQKLIDEYVREEVLYREAKALGMERGDYVMRQRLVQKMGFLLEQHVQVQPTDAELQKYLDTHHSQYHVAPSWTFTHVFLDRAQRGEEQARREAQRLLGVLNAQNAQFNDAPRFTDRFAFLQNYVERTQEYITSQFGTAFTAALMRLPVDARHWQGPLESDEGWHLVLFTAHTAGGVPALAEIRPRVADDWRRDREAQLQEQSVRALVDSYKVELRDVTGR